MRRLKTFRYGLLALLLYTGICPAQQHFQTRFQVLDHRSELPVVYATVILEHAQVGVISDDNGNFRIPGIYKSRQDTLKISCIGYSTKLVPLTTQKENDINKIFLSPKVESLDEVKLFIHKNEKKMSAGRIVKEAIKRIPDNYPVKPFSYIGYYRDYQQVADSSYLADMNVENKNAYINLNEGVIQVFDAGFGTNRLTDNTNQTVLYEFQSNENFPIDTALTIPYDNRKQKYLDGVIISPLGGNELNLLHLTNALRNYNRNSFSFAHVFNRHFLGNHIFKLNKLLYMDDEPIYTIDFVSNYRRVNPGYRAEGSISISKQDFGIYNLDYKLFNDQHDLLYRVNIAYKPMGDLYYLNYITFNNYFEVKGGGYFKVDKVEYHYESSSFQVFFNEAVDPDSIKVWHKQFKFIIESEQVLVLDVKLMAPAILKIKVKSSNQIDKAILNDGIRYEINHLRDVNGRILNKKDILHADQFREFFVQKVFPGSRFDSSYNFVDKSLPLKASKLNTFKGKETYWINTPLKASK